MHIAITHTLSLLLYLHFVTDLFTEHMHCTQHSPFPEGRYDFSTLWGVYVSGDTEKLQVKVNGFELTVNLLE